jgi:hypothetical protein
MRIARKLALLAIAAVAAMSFMAASASATQTVEVSDMKKIGNQHCGNTVGVPPNVPDTRCLVHAVGLAELRVDLGIFGEAHEATCNVEILFRVNETGVGSVINVNNTPGDDNCPTVAPACNLPWPSTGEEDGPTGIVQSSATVCIDPAEGPVCSGSLAFDIVNQGGHYETQFNNRTVGLCELDVDLEIEYENTAHADIEVAHP